MGRRLTTIIVARKPLEGTVAENVLRWGCGALNIGDSRIQGPAWKWGTQTDIKGGGYGSKRPSEGNVLARDVESNPKGRWPANLILEHLPGCQKVGVAKVKGHKGYPNGPGGVYSHDYQQESPAAKSWNAFSTQQENQEWRGHANPDGSEDIDQWECVEGCPVGDLGEQSGDRPPGQTNNGASVGESSKGVTPIRRGTLVPRSDTGTVARFFKQVQHKKAQSDDDDHGER